MYFPQILAAYDERARWPDKSLSSPETPLELVVCSSVEPIPYAGTAADEAKSIVQSVHRPKYQFIVTTDGRIYWTDQLIASTRVYLPLGAGQDPTAEQWLRTTELFDNLAAEYHTGMTMRADDELTQSLCDKLAEFLSQPRPFVVRSAIYSLPVRLRPEFRAPYERTLEYGDLIICDARVNDLWYRLADGSGYVFSRYSTPLSPVWE